MNLSTKIKLFFQNLWNSWPVEQQMDTAYLTVVPTDDFNVEVDFNFTIESAGAVANMLFQLDSGMLTGTIVDAISQQCVLDNREDEFQAFMTALSLISISNTELTDIAVSEAVIKPSQVFKYTVEQPKLS